jgi:glucokinase
VVGGGVCQAGELLLRPARESFRRTLPGRGFRTEPRIVAAQLGPDAGMVGAADLARHEQAVLTAAGPRTSRG